MAMKKQQVVSISTEYEEIYIGTTEKISVVQDNVKLISDRGVVYEGED